LKDHGATPKGVDWNGEKSQFLRFERLLRSIQLTDGASILDFGCGYGSLTNLLRAQNLELNYYGYDMVPEMLNDIKFNPSKLNEIYFSESEKLDTYDWIVASGVFNVKRDATIEDWEDYIVDTIRYLESIANKGLTLNFLSLCSDEDKRKNHLYYASPFELLAKIGFNHKFEILIDHNYPLWEFTITIRK
jgi:cyclopropane fatty-acyl-phospholipid synthase-like methyltransferase